MAETIVSKADSILTSIKKLLGLEAEYTIFDDTIAMHINTVLSSMAQMGIGPVDGLEITGTTETWADLIEDKKLVQQVRSYLYIKVRLLFDPPANGNLLDSLNKQATELEWRLYVQETPPPVVVLEEEV